MKHFKFSKYLEIGVSNGHIFFKIQSTFKIAVDPEFAFDGIRKIGKTIFNPHNLYNQYFEKTSDSFFDEDAKQLFCESKIQIALVDGMHEYEYALRDVENTLKYLDDNGVIILHDCNPQTPEAACSFKEWRENKNQVLWNGDVWKTVLHLRSLRPDLTTFVLDCDHGLGIITKRPSEILPFTKEEIKKFSYEDFIVNRSTWLNLKPTNFFYEYFKIKNTQPVFKKIISK